MTSCQDKFSHLLQKVSNSPILHGSKRCFSPLCVLNAFTREQAEKQHIQVVSDRQAEDITELSKSYELIGILPLGQLLLSDTDE